MSQTTFEIVSMNAGMKEWHMRHNQSILFWQKLETCWPWDHAVICRVIIQTIPCSPFLLAQIKNQPLIHLKHSLNTFSPYLLQSVRWMKISLETSATDTTERWCKNTININDESSWKLKIGTHYRMSRFG